MNPFDHAVISFLNSFAHRAPTIDNFVSLLAGNMLLKGAVFVFLFWWLWFRRGPKQARDRGFLLLAPIAPLFAIFVSRIVAHSFPFRERPLRAPGLHFHLPYGIKSVVLEGWSSFPSDHAAFFFALAVIFFFVYRRAGIFAIVYSVLVVCLPRMYLGIHYPTDLIAGVLIGTGIACLSLIAGIRQAVARPVLQYMHTNPAVSYGCLSVLTYFIGTVCEPAPELIRFVFKVMAGSLARTGHPLHVSLGRQSILEPLAVGLAATGVIAALTLLWRRRLALVANDPELTASLIGKGGHGQWVETSRRGKA